MFAIDKIKYNVHPKIIETINELTNTQQIEKLKQWLILCNEEITRRESLLENTYPLYYEKQYLEMVLR